METARTAKQFNLRFRDFGFKVGFVQFRDSMKIDALLIVTFEAIQHVVFDPLLVPPLRWIHRHALQK
jgi:hypothetical protein